MANQAGRIGGRVERTSSLRLGRQQTRPRCLPQMLQPMGAGPLVLAQYKGANAQVRAAGSIQAVKRAREKEELSSFLPVGVGGRHQKGVSAGSGPPMATLE